jgi:hypothetical protein
LANFYRIFIACLNELNTHRKSPFEEFNNIVSTKAIV